MSVGALLKVDRRACESKSAGRFQSLSDGTANSVKAPAKGKDQTMAIKMEIKVSIKMADVGRVVAMWSAGR